MDDSRPPSVRIVVASRFLSKKHNDLKRSISILGYRIELILKPAIVTVDGVASAD